MKIVYYEHRTIIVRFKHDISSNTQNSINMLRYGKYLRDVSYQQTMRLIAHGINNNPVDQLNYYRYPGFMENIFTNDLWPAPIDKWFKFSLSHNT